MRNLNYFKSFGNLIAYHEPNCDTLGLGEKEKFAIIAHELGHIFNRDKDYGDNHLLREQDADCIAVSLELTESLIDGLTIFCDKGVFGNGGNEQMRLRIAALREYLGENIK